jgi:precorrin-6B methylase 2
MLNFLSMKINAFRSSTDLDNAPFQSWADRGLATASGVGPKSSKICAGLAIPTLSIIGYGEGYYAVGLASRVPHTRVHAFDLDARAVELTRRLAELNGVVSCVIVSRGCSRDQLKTVSVDSRILVLSDCEDDEYQLIDPAWLPVAGSIDLFVECHDSAAHLAMAEELQRRFATTYEGEIIESRPRDSSDYPLLVGWSSGEIEMALSESRPLRGMKWLSLRQKIDKK